MVDREDQSNLPPIPDGGLAESMPDWLRRPPAWRTLPDREVTVPEPEATADLPEADDSVIDPRAFLSDDDLPAWLRTLGRGRVAVAPSDGEPHGEPQPPDPIADDASASRTVAPRFVPASPPASPSAPSARDRLHADRPESRSTPAAVTGRQATGLVTLLAALLLIAIVVIVILLVA